MILFISLMIILCRYRLNVNKNNKKIKKIVFLHTEEKLIFIYIFNNQMDNNNENDENQENLNEEEDDDFPEYANEANKDLNDKVFS